MAIFHCYVNVHQRVVVMLWVPMIKLPKIWSIETPPLAPLGLLEVTAKRGDNLSTPEVRTVIHFAPKSTWVCLKMLCTPKANGFADHYPVFKWLFHWEYTLFSDKPTWFNHEELPLHGLVMVSAARSALVSIMAMCGLGLKRLGARIWWGVKLLYNIWSVVNGDRKSVSEFLLPACFLCRVLVLY